MQFFSLKVMFSEVGVESSTNHRNFHIEMSDISPHLIACCTWE